MYIYIYTYVISCLALRSVRSAGRYGAAVAVVALCLYTCIYTKVYIYVHHICMYVYVYACINNFLALDAVRSAGGE